MLSRFTHQPAIQPVMFTHKTIRFKSVFEFLSNNHSSRFPHVFMPPQRMVTYLGGKVGPSHHEMNKTKLVESRMFWG